MGEQFRALGDDLVPVASDHLAKGVVDFQDYVFEIDEDRASHALLEREAEALLATSEGIDGTQLGLNGAQLGLEGGVVCCFLGDVLAYHRRSITKPC
jgi:hypothetical protein